VARDDNTVEPFKRVLAGTMRAIARDDELEVSFGVQEASAAGHTAQLTQPPRDLDAASVARSRGEADALALKLRHHDAAKHAKRQPAGEIGRAIFDAVGLSITLAEGKNRQVRRMFEAVGLPVEKLVRVAFGPLMLGKLPAGAWRQLEPNELNVLRAATAGRTSRPAPAPAGNRAVGHAPKSKKRGRARPPRA
jgi:hypothetical protein